jgi:hypothetical protein
MLKVAMDSLHLGAWEWNTDTGDIIWNRCAANRSRAVGGDWRRWRVTSHALGADARAVCVRYARAGCSALMAARLHACLLRALRRHMYRLFDKDVDEPMGFTDGIRRMHPDDVVRVPPAREAMSAALPPLN